MRMDHSMNRTDGVNPERLGEKRPSQCYFVFTKFQFLTHIENIQTANSECC
jgi:hypothetical protein